MPAWWGRKSSKSKEGEVVHQNSEGGGHYNTSKNSIRNEKKKGKDKPKSFDDGFFSRNSPRNSKDYGPLTGSGGGSSGFSGFDSDCGDKIKGHPLPLPSTGIEHGVGSGSVSVSSVSSSGSSDDHPSPHDHALFGVYRGQGETRFNARSRSPGPGSRCATSPTSPLHPRFSTSNLDSPTGKQEEGRSCHRLPLPPSTPTSPSALPSGRTCVVTESTPCNLSRWKKGRLLGRGTFGHVYVGFNSESGQMCAIKEVKVVSDDHSSKECLKQLNQEINLLSQLSHPNIVQYHGSEMGEDTLSVYLEYVSGGSIHKLLNEYGPFKEPVIQNYARQIISGLAYLHGRSTVHRDIKGANILVGPNGEIKLADFGMAKHRTRKENLRPQVPIVINSSSSMLSFKGSPYWMAPEVVMNTNGYSLAVDIWSLGCTILEMATSKPPWSQYEGVAAIFKIGNSRDVPEIPDHLSNDAKSFIRLCLQRDPMARPTALQLLDHPFVKDQATTRTANISITREAFPSTFDGSRTPTALELPSNRTGSTFSDGDYLTRPVGMVSRVAKNSRDSVRMITSLPVSPSSSPLRHHGLAHRSCFLSPPHPSYPMVGQSSYNSNDYSIYPTRSITTYAHDLWFEAPQFKSQTTNGSPRTRPI